VKVFHPTGDRAGEIIEGESPEQAALLVDKLREKNLI
jgi:hypothetical protein